MDVWPYASRPFNVSVRWQHCLSSRVELAANETVADYGALLSAELGRLSVLGGGAVRLLDGTYPVKSPIIFGNNTCLLGESLNGVVLEVANDAPESPASRGVLHGINVLNVTVRDLTVDANKHGQEDDDKGNYKCENELTKYGTYFEASSYLWFTNTRVINACAYGCTYT